MNANIRPTAFTDDDLNKLKGFLSIDDFYDPESGRYMRPLVHALIKRLEASEAVGGFMTYSQDMSPNDIKIYELQKELDRFRTERDALVNVLVQLGLRK